MAGLQVKSVSFFKGEDRLTYCEKDFEYTIMKAGVPNAHRVLTKMEDGPADAPVYYQEILFRLQGVVMDVRLGGVKRCSSRVIGNLPPSHLIFFKCRV